MCIPLHSTVLALWHNLDKERVGTLDLHIISRYVIFTGNLRLPYFAYRRSLNKQ